MSGLVADSAGRARGFEEVSSIRIPADVDIDDRVLGMLTFRQVVILGATAALLYTGWLATRAVVPVLVYVAVAAIIAAPVAVVALGHRDGIGLDRWTAAAITGWMTTRPVREPLHPAEAPGWLTGHTTPAPPAHTPGFGPTRLPRQPITLAPRGVAPSSTRSGAAGPGGVGVIDLGAHGTAVVAACSTINFALRTPTEQDALCATFGRWLHSAAGPVHLLIRAVPMDLRGHVDAVNQAAATLPHPALAAAAADHAVFLADLAAEHDLLRRHVLLILREPAIPAPGRGREQRSRRAAATEVTLIRRLTEAAELLAPAGITVTALTGTQAGDVLSGACHPGRDARTAAFVDHGPGITRGYPATYSTATNPTIPWGN